MGIDEVGVVWNLLELLPYWRIYLARGSLLSLSISLLYTAALPLQIAWMGFIQEFFYEPPPSNVMSESVVLRLSQASGLLN